MTLKMVKESVPGPDEACEYDGGQFSDVIVVGRVIGMEEENMRTIMELEDTTETHKVTFYQRGDSQVPAPLRGFNYNPEVDQWVRIYGFIRVYND